MFLAKITFGRGNRAASDKLEDLAHSYLAALLRVGQLCGRDYFLAWHKGVLSAHVLLAGRDACQLRYHSKWGQEDLKKVTAAFGQKPVWTFLDEQAKAPISTWKGVPFLYLFTHAFDNDSPVCRSDGRRPVPVYRLPVPVETKDGLYAWRSSYRELDNIWLGCGKLEIATYRQLAEPRSELAEQGRRLCREIESATGRPTYYYLMRYWGRTKGEADRPCPLCGGSWKTAPDARPDKPFYAFDFRCEPCRLVSHIGDSYDNPRRARIGDFSPAKPLG